MCAVSEVVPVTSARTVAYLAQHPLLEQCPQLARDAAPWPRFVQEAVARGPRARSEASSPSSPPGLRAPRAPRRRSSTRRQLDGVAPDSLLIYVDRPRKFDRVLLVVGRKLRTAADPEKRRPVRKHVAARRRVHRRRATSARICDRLACFFIPGGWWLPRRDARHGHARSVWFGKYYLDLVADRVAPCVLGKAVAILAVAAGVIAPQFILRVACEGPRR